MSGISTGNEYELTSCEVCGGSATCPVERLCEKHCTNVHAHYPGAVEKKRRLPDAPQRKPKDDVEAWARACFHAEEG